MNINNKIRTIKLFKAYFKDFPKKEKRIAENADVKIIYLKFLNFCEL